jgi:hypothetical protein
LQTGNQNNISSGDVLVISGISKQNHSELL